LIELELVVFDIAGTVVEDDGQVPAAFTAALAKHGFDVTPEQLKNARGSSKRQALLQFVPPGPDQAQIAVEVYASFKDHLAQQYAAKGVRAVPGTVQAFHWLRDHDVRVALNTGFDREITGLLLAALGWTHGMVDAVVCEIARETLHEEDYELTAGRCILSDDLIHEITGRLHTSIKMDSIDRQVLNLADAIGTGSEFKVLY